MIIQSELDSLMLMIDVHRPIGADGATCLFIPPSYLFDMIIDFFFIYLFGNNDQNAADLAN